MKRTGAESGFNFNSSGIATLYTGAPATVVPSGVACLSVSVTPGIQLNCLVLFGFIYPAERARIPIRVMTLLLERLKSELETDMELGRVCRGPLVSREQYLPHTLQWGYTDGRIAPLGSITPEQVGHWTGAIGT